MRKVCLLLAVGVLCLTQTYGEEGRGGLQSHKDGVVHLGGFSLVINDSIEPPIMYPEPSFTQGNSNTVYWSSNYDTFFVQYDTTDSLDSPTTSPPVSDTFWTPGNELVNGQTYWYRVLAKSGSEASRWSDSAFSTQDADPPMIMGVRVLETNPLGWCNNDTFHVSFISSDPAGIDSIQLYYRLRGESMWIPSSSGRSYRPDPITGEPFVVDTTDTLLFTTHGDAWYELFIWARDAAHAPWSHGCDSVHLPCPFTWVVDGNPRPLGSPDTVAGVDTHPPKSEVICDSLSDTTRAAEFKIWFSASDSVYPSGLDTVWLYARDESGTFVVECTVDSFPDSSSVETSCPFKAVSGDGWYYFYTKAKDVARNCQDTIIAICSTYVTTQCLISFHMYDRDSPSREVYTDDTLVGAACSLIIGTTEHPYDICFAMGLDSVCFDTLDSLYFNSVTRIIDTIISLPNPGHDSLKIVWCQARDLVNDTVSNWACDSITLDQEPCSVDSLILYDFQQWPYDTLRGACDGWTDSVWIWAKPLRISCQKAGPESLCFYGDIDPSPYCVSHAESVLLQLTEGDEGRKICSCTVIDSAGNRSDSVSDTVTLDTAIDGVLTIDAKPETLVNETNISIWFNLSFDDLNAHLFLSEKWMIFDDTTYLQELQPYMNPEAGTIKPWIGWHRILAAVRDSAGNWSNTACDSVYYWGECRLDSIVVIDPEPLEGPGTARRGWSNDDTVMIIVFRSGAQPDGIMIVDCPYGATVCDTVTVVNAIDTIPMSIDTDYREHYIEARLICGDTLSDPRHSTIICESTNPHLDTMYVVDSILSGGKKWVFSEIIDIYVQAWDEEPGELYCYEITENGSRCRTGTFPTGYESIRMTLLDTLCSEEEGQKALEFVLYDAAGNASNTIVDVIVLDKRENDPEIVGFPNPFDPNKQEMHIRVRDSKLAKVRIYDPFGNLVRILREVDKIGDYDFIWDGRNGRGEIVANGGYLAVIPGKRHLCKIAVLKR